MTLIPNLSIQDKPVVKTQHSSPSKPLHHAQLNVDGSGSSRNAEHEINEGHNSDDSDEEWKRRNGHKMSKTGQSGRKFDGAHHIPPHLR